MSAVDDGDRVVVVGGGWAGLAAACELAARGVPVTLIEAAQHVGGRARTIELDGRSVDNGQHLLLGACTSTLKLLATIGVRESDALLRLPLDLSLRRLDGGETIEMSSLYLPAPWHLLAGLLGMRGITLGERLKAISGLPSMLRETPDEQETVDGWLRRHGQSPDLIEGLWEPLCLSILNTPGTRASAGLFVTTLQESFMGSREHSDLLVPKVDLGRLLPQPASRFIETTGGDIRLGTRVTHLRADDNRVTGLHLADDTELPAPRVILATPPWITAQLLAEHPQTAAIAQDLAALAYEPICTVYIQYPESVKLGAPLVGVLDATSQWVFDRSYTGHPGLMAVVISGGGPHMDLDNRMLIGEVQAELRRLFPHWPEPLGGWAVREKRATFRAAPGCETLRPAHATALTGLWLAGDYTRTGLPATLEGAIRSGIQAAQTANA
ncbi:MAG: hydroxysqualene dehydroxylase HpnE [Ectothiorhodospiraceae bacterium]|nr:hydroxysqualene dehydroxylase HpnE [Ectothiorhodospiraceae bacterium]